MPAEPTDTQEVATTPAMLEAARYALLRRLAAPIRHDMAAHLQPIGMLGEVLARRLAAASPDMPPVREGVARLTSLARSAVHASLDVVAWLAPEPERRVALAEAVGEIVSLLRSHLGFRGIVLEADPVDPQAGTVVRSSVRIVLPAALLLLADDAGPPASIRISCAVRDASAVLALELEPSDGDEAIDLEPSYRRLSREEVAMLAAAEAIAYAHEGDRITLAVPVR